MLNTVVVDDEIHSLKRMANLVKEAEKLELVGSYNQADVFLEDINEGVIKPELVLLDIEMPGINGLQLLQKIMEIDEGIDVVFVTAYNQYAVKAFELNALDYLLKPVTRHRFQETISRLDFEKNIYIKNSYKLKVLTLGKLKILQNGKEINIDWTTEKSRELFVYLLYHYGDFIASDKIVDNLWNDNDPERSFPILYTTVYNLRKIFRENGFKEIILSKRGFYSLNDEKVQWDVDEFKKLAEKTQHDIEKNINYINKLIKLYQGEYLQDRNYNWVYSLRAELEEKLKKILIESADYCVDKGEFEKAENLLKKILKESFLAEKAHKMLIEVYKRQGKEAAARKQFEEFKTKMKNEYGIEPGIDIEF